MARHFFRYLASLPLTFLLSVCLHAQNAFLISGRVTDAHTGEGVEMATIRLLGPGGGASSDSAGYFSFRVPVLGDSLMISQIGYTSFTIPLDARRLTNISVSITENTFTLKEAVISADPFPGKTIIRKVLANSSNNNPARFGRLDARLWTRSEVAAFDPVAKIDTAQAVARGGLLFGDKVRAYEKVRPVNDTLRGETPLFFLERLVDYSIGNQPFMENENVIAVKSTNLESDKLLEPLARWNAASINLYNDRVNLFGKTFVSPISTDALLYYDFYIEDSLALPNGFHRITLQAIPKTWHGNVFTGMVTIEDSAYALVGADLRLSKDANLNFIEAMSIHQEFGPATDFATGRQVLAPSLTGISLRYEAGLELLGVPLPASADSKRLVSYITARFDSVRVNDPNTQHNFQQGIGTEIHYSADTGESGSFWEKNRPDSLTAHESAIYQMADNLRNDPIYRLKDKLYAIFGTGAYYIGDKMNFGPVGALMSYNPIEGTRFRVGFRTMEGTFKKTGIYGHAAYGVGDHQWKGSIGLKQLWNTVPFSKTEIFAGSDYEAVSKWYDEIDKDGFINTLLRKRVPYYQTFQQQITITHDQQIGANWYIRAGVSARNIRPSFDFKYANPDYISANNTPDEQAMVKSIPIAEASIAIRFAWHERSRIYDYTRIPVASKFPAVALVFTQGFRVMNADFVYQKVNIDISHTTHITPKAALMWNLDAGKIFGTLPSLLLEIPPGNDAYVMSRYVFNTMRPYEFAADRYVSLKTRLSLGGMLFDRVPYLQKLGWRERVSFNAFWGDATAANRNFNASQKLLTPNGPPFMEAGIGVENIFHLFSLDYIRRLSYLNVAGAAGNRSGIFLGMKLAF